MVEEGGVKKFLIDGSDFFLRLMFVFFVNRLCYSCYSPNIPSNNIKVRNQDD